MKTKMQILLLQVKRNVKLFFRDKGMFFSSLATPLILLVLYATFLGNVYEDSFLMNMPEGFAVDASLIDGLVGGQLLSSILSVSCVTVAFCSNFLMVQDKANGTRRDLTIAPVPSSLLSSAYFIASLLATLIICLVAMGAGFLYLAFIGWYLSFADVLLLLLDILLLTLFGTALSSVVNYFLSTQGQISAVGSIISAGYGFICGAYMPISQFSEGLQNAVLFLPGTYGTSLLRGHAVRGVMDALGDAGIPEGVISSIGASIDCELSFFGHAVPEAVMYVVLVGSTALLFGIFVLLNAGIFSKKSMIR